MKRLVFILSVIFTGLAVKAQNVGIGTATPNVNAALEIKSSTKGILMPRTSTVTKNAMTAVPKGMMVYDSSHSAFYYHDGNKWRHVADRNMDSLLTDYSNSPVVTANMGSSSGTTAQSGILYDNGGPAGNYAANSNNTYTVNRTGNSVTDSVIGFKVIIQEMNLESPYDSLEVYSDIRDKIVITGTTLGTYYFAAATDLKFRFRSNAVNNLAGFKIVWSVLTISNGVTEEPPLYGWYFNAKKLAVRGGLRNGNDWATDSLGKFSFAYGYDARAKGLASVAFMEGKATGDYSLSIGKQSYATGHYAIAIGFGGFFGGLTAAGEASIAIGFSNYAAGELSRAIGTVNNVTGYSATAIGDWNSSTNEGSIAFGNTNYASGKYALAMGSNTSASGDRSTAMGRYTNADGEYSTAFGKYTKATGYASTAMGDSTEASGLMSFAIGFRSSASGIYSTAIGSRDTAIGIGSIAMGNNNTANGYYSGSIAIGNGNNASSTSTSTAIGYNNTATSTYGSTAIGVNNTANADYSTALGYNTIASGHASATIGLATISRGYAGTVVGMYNDAILFSPQTLVTNATPLFIIGNGNDNSNRSNAMVVRKDGNIGMGTNSPDATLHIRHAGGGGLILENENDGNTWRIYSASGDNNLTFYNNAGTEIADIDDVSGTFNALSDSRYKKDIQSMPSVLSMVMQLQPKQYHFNWQKQDEQIQLGFIAQDACKLFPELVSYDKEKDLYKMNYAGFSTVAIKAIQEQQTIIETLQQQMKNMQKQIDELKKNR